MKQWELHEANRVPLATRSYFLKRVDGPYIGTESISQDEDDFTGSWIDTQKKAAPKCNPPSTVLDLRKSDSSTDDDKNVILDLSMPDSNASTAVCYVCGKEFPRGTLANVHAKPSGVSPFFPSLMLHPRPSKSRPMDPSGRVLACEECHKHLLHQWREFEGKKVSHAERRYMLGRENVQYNHVSTFVCYTCGLEYPLSAVCFIYTKQNAEDEPFYPSVALMKPYPGVIAISAKGTVQEVLGREKEAWPYVFVCTKCHDQVSQFPKAVKEEKKEDQLHTKVKDSAREA
ncbi:unnamed protein product [Darwinula stevensoni]|uniref:Uncharacterized protein n=1 Tax=Darwinula stevensoni TaxID=69355 RepID=A0A7R9AA88_9CRUS|nr:unnamed protein product [Darwinula stevensoni]CAG0898040.1 unnamed protein product [Darwinula stevensoni]